MTRAKLPGSWDRLAEQLKGRISTLEKRLQNALDALRDTSTFDLVGQIYVSESGNLPLNLAKRAISIEATLVEAGVTNTHVELRRSGDVVAELDLPAGQTRVKAGISVPYATLDLVQVACTEAGTDANSLVVLVTWK